MRQGSSQEGRLGCGRAVAKRDGLGCGRAVGKKEGWGAAGQ